MTITRATSFDKREPTEEEMRLQVDLCQRLVRVLQVWVQVTPGLPSPVPVNWPISALMGAMQWVVDSAPAEDRAKMWAQVKELADGKLRKVVL